MKAITALFFLFFSVQAHKHWIEPKAKKIEDNPYVLRNHRKVREPMVQEPGRWCIFENDDDNWCWETTPPFVNIGWENEQVFYDNTTLAKTNEFYSPVKYYQWKINYFADIQAFFQSQFFITLLYYNEATFYIPKFRANAFTSVIVNGDMEICPGAGTEIEHVEFLLDMTMKFNDCYKVILSDICEY